MGIRRSGELVVSEFRTDAEGHPTGGDTEMLAPATGVPVIGIEWQDGVIGPEGQNGAFIEDVIEAALQRLRWFNSQPAFRCRENSLAITDLESAQNWLDRRTANRVSQGVENTYRSHEA